MATAKQLPREMTIDEYFALPEEDKKGVEYWFGKVIRKGMPTWFHSIVQQLIGGLLLKAGYISGSELELRIMRNWAPKPDVAAALHPDLTKPYPTTQCEVDVIVEIKSPDDSDEWYEHKGGLYAKIGVQQTYLIDPVARELRLWVDGKLKPVLGLSLPNHKTIPASDIWAALDRIIAQSRMGTE